MMVLVTMAEKGETKRESFIIKHRKRYIISILIILWILFFLSIFIFIIDTPDYKDMYEIYDNLEDTDNDGKFDKYNNNNIGNKILLRDKLTKIVEETDLFDKKTFITFESTKEYRDILPLYDITFLGVFKNKNMTGEDIVIIVFLDIPFEVNKDSNAIIEINTLDIFLLKDYQNLNTTHNVEIFINISILLFLLGFSIPTIITYQKELPFKNFTLKDKKVFSFSVGILFSVIGYAFLILPYITEEGIVSLESKRPIVKGEGLVSGFREIFYNWWFFYFVITIIISLIIFLIVTIITHSIIDKKSRDKQKP